MIWAFLQIRLPAVWPRGKRPAVAVIQGRENGHLDWAGRHRGLRADRPEMYLGLGARLDED